MNVLTVEGCDEGRIQLDEDSVSNVVALVLDALDLLNPSRDIRVILEKIAQLAGSTGEVVRHICKEVEELGFAWEEADHNGGEVSNWAGRSVQNRPEFVTIY
jgi:hypothetical protein